MSRSRYPIPLLVSACAAVALGSCSKDDAPEPEHASQQALEQPPATEAAPARSADASGDSDSTQKELQAGCPMLPEEVAIEVTDTEDGAALVFTTEADAVDELRARVQHMAGMYEMHGGRRGMTWHRMRDQARGGGDSGVDSGIGVGRGPMARRGPLPATTAEVSRVDRGARLTLRAVDSSQLAAVREHARWHRQRMARGECWMLHQTRGTAPTDGDGNEVGNEVE